MGLDPSSNPVICALGDSMHNALLWYTTSDWVNLAPRVVEGLEGLMQELAPGVMLGDSFSDLAPGAAAAVTSPVAVSSSSSLPSPSTAPPALCTLSSGSAISRPSSHDSGAESATACPMCPLPKPKAAYCSKRIVSPPSDAAKSPVVATAPVAATCHPASLVHRAASSTVLTLVASQSSAVPSCPAKRSAPAEGVSPIEPQPPGWRTCVFCKKHRSRCSPAKGSKPPYKACTSCINNGRECIPVDALSPDSAAPAASGALLVLSPFCFSDLFLSFL